MNMNMNMNMNIKNISLYIPHVFPNYTKEDVANVFESLNIGKISNIDFVSKMGQDSKLFNAAYIHFERWFNNSAAVNFQERVINPNKEARIVYEEPWYWIVLENKARKYVPGERKPRINLDEFPALSTSTPMKATKEEKKCPRAPVKEKCESRALQFNGIAINFDDAFEVEDEDMEQMEMDAEMDAEMDEIEALIEEEERHLVNIDSRYVGSLEAENMELRSQLAYFQNMLYVEQIKSQALAEAFGKMKQE
jgi:heat shock protein HspQ